MSQSHAPTEGRLGKVPQILQILVDGNVINKDQQKNIVANIGQPGFEGLFAGGVAVRMGMVEQEQVNAGLRSQSLLIAQAAVDDMQDIINGKQSIYEHNRTYNSSSESSPNHISEMKAILTYPAHCTPHWGNKDKDGNIIVNEISNHITPDTAASAAANIGKLITLLANSNSLIIAMDVQKGVVAAKSLTEYAVNGNTKTSPAHLTNEWIDSAKEALYTLAAYNNLDLRQYSNNRFEEVSKGIEMKKEQEASKSTNASHIRG